jgi:hypothetical protein
MAQAYGAVRELYFNTDQNLLCDVSGTPLPSSKQRINVTSYGKYVFKMTFLKDGGTASDAWSGQTTFWATIDDNYDKTSAAYVSVLAAAFNVAGDWQVLTVEQPDPETGKLCCRVDCADARLATRFSTGLTNAASGSFDLEIHGIRGGESRSCGILRIPLTIKNAQQIAEGTPEPTLDNLYVSHSEYDALITDPSVIVVSKGGNDSTGTGAFTRPFLTVAKAITLWTVARNTIIILPGTYSEAATLTWPNLTGLQMVGIGQPSIANGNSAAQVILINPTFTASTLEATLKGINIAADTQIGVNIDNANMTKKLIIYLDGVTMEMSTSGDSVNVAGTTATQAVRLYIDNCNFEGLVHFTASVESSRLRCSASKFVGGITTAGAVAAELCLRNCEVLTGGLTIGSATWNLTYRGCLYATDADPAVYSELADGYSA